LNIIVIISSPIENRIIFFALPYMQGFINMIKKISRNRKFLIFSIQSGKLNSFFNRVIIYKLGIIFIIIIYRNVFYNSFSYII